MTDKMLVLTWIYSAARPGFHTRADAANGYIDIGAWAEAIRRGWVDSDGFWVGSAGPAINPAVCGDHKNRVRYMAGAFR